MNNYRARPGQPHRHYRVIIAAALLTLYSVVAAAQEPAAHAAPVAVLLAAGDIAECGSAGAQRTAELIDNMEGLVLAAGDLAYPSGTLRDFMKCYEPTWGRFKSRTLPAPGNHEYGIRDAAGYFAYFGKQAGENGKGYYSIDLQGWHLIALNSNIDIGASSEQMRWLQQDLTKNQASCILAFWHHPRYTSGPHGDTQHMAPAWEQLARHHASIVISGHDHNYERLAPLDAKGFKQESGIRSFVVGTGGAKLYNFGMRSNYSDAWNGTTWGVLKLSLFPGRYTWEFVPVQGGQYQDLGEGRCAG